MSPALEPMSFDELSELYRVEMKSSAITQVRKDLFRAMANLLTALRLEYDRQMALDPESVMCEGAEQRRKKAERLAKDVVHIRTQKICQMAIRGAMGGRNTVDMLTDEERDYYERVLDLSKRHMSEIDRLRGRKNTVATHIDEVHTVEESRPVTETAEPAPAEVVQTSTTRRTTSRTSPSPTISTTSPRFPPRAGASTRTSLRRRILTVRSRPDTA